MTADVYIKSGLYCSSDSCYLTASGMIGEMKWNELSRTEQPAWKKPTPQRPVS